MARTPLLKSKKIGGACSDPFSANEAGATWSVFFSWTMLYAREEVRRYDRSTKLARIQLGVWSRNWPYI
ncbi:uncharacterized protein MYCFIDRAFT_176870 [Pseudocercospora fijiensis CIRAD86]|uniref:Uncharacterized protein n=1 Tax=Pseudocercospora fijiensis (strain CIRAD86) TaxID=383855 RepID=M3ARY3_PSEFD|nr:uncharacterized protein MYCFIDRAFT_176870 [Pseudocercospora fijiensis CIRAD86]EME79863.1 hypothetical protein MYCFIDRAFT_176870 [Pseudocercospora fijiensis CIRAD86]